MAIEKELTYLDLVVLQKVGLDSYLEKFGQKINTGFFETANLAGALKIKGYINFQPAIGALTPITLTDEGKNVLKTADLRAGEELDKLDEALLNIIGERVKDTGQIAAELNVRQSDLALHLHKLVHKGLADYNLRSAKVQLQLTDKGFSTLGHRPKPRKMGEDIGSELTGGRPAPRPEEGMAAKTAEETAEVETPEPEMQNLMVARPGKLMITGQMRLNARIQYWRERYGLIVLVALLLIVAASAYLLFFR